MFDELKHWAGTQGTTLISLSLTLIIFMPVEIQDLIAPTFQHPTCTNSLQNNVCV